MKEGRESVGASGPHAAHFSGSAGPNAMFSQIPPRSESDVASLLAITSSDDDYNDDDDDNDARRSGLHCLLRGGWRLGGG